MDLPVKAHGPAGFDHTNDGKARGIDETGRALKYFAFGLLLGAKSLVVWT